MRLTARLVSWILLGVVVLLVVDATLFVRREGDLLREDMRGKARQLGRALRGPVADAWQEGGEAEALRLVQDANNPDHAIRVRLVRLREGTDARFAPSVPVERLAADGSETSVEAKGPEGSDCLYTYVPLPEVAAADAALELREEFSRLEDLRRSTQRRFLAISGALLVGGAGSVALFGVVFLGRPLRRLIEKTKRVGSGDLGDPVALPGRYELTDLADAINQMCARLAEAERTVRAETDQRIAALEQLRHADRLKTVGQLASGVAHELGTPLNVVSGYAGRIASGRLPEEEVKRSAEIIRGQAGRMGGILLQLLDFARSRTPKRRPSDLQDLARRTVDLVATLGYPGRAVVVPPDGTASVCAEVDAAQVEQVLTNLLVNALQATPAGGAVEVSVRKVRRRPPPRVRRPEGEYVRLAVRDGGSGIPPENLERIFDPFFTTKEVGRGAGLGLSIVHGIVRDHGGWIEVRSEVGKGSLFEVFVPETVA
ncbi:MAG TPA: ATP-binding protein [Planctomycetota bacterium]|jgi:signal transduction histidine kinase|nr:ATP-binding protein [Planctomycetota bacterium]